MTLSESVDDFTVQVDGDSYMVVISEQVETTESVQLGFAEGVTPPADVLSVDEQSVLGVVDSVLEVVSAGEVGPPGPTGPPGDKVTEYTAATAVGGHRVVYVDANGEVTYADNTVGFTSNAVAGITSNAAAQGVVVSVFASGVMVEPTWSWIPQGVIYVGENGILTQTQPEYPAATYSMIVATATAADSILIRLREPLFLGA